MHGYTQSIIIRAVRKETAPAGYAPEICISEGRALSHKLIIEDQFANSNALPWQAIVAANLLFWLVFWTPPAVADKKAWRCESDVNGYLLCHAAGPVLPTPALTKGPSALDWQPAAPDAGEGVCAGAYAEPETSGAEANIEPRDAPLRASADTAELREDESQVSLVGNVGLQQGFRSIRADRLDYYRDQDRIELNGNIEVREPGMLLRGDAAQINPRTGKATLDHANYVLHRQHARGQARQISRDEDDIIRVADGSYTYCPPGNNNWLVKSNRIRINRDKGYGVARHAKLHVAKVPVMYTPYIRFPIDDRRLSGFLWPHFGYTAESGIDATVPYYFNLAPNYDATLTPRHLGDRGTMASLETRYLNSWSQSVVSGSLLPDDNETSKHRWLAQVLHNGRPGGNFSSRIDYSKVSDDDYFDDLSNGGLELERHAQLRQLGAVGYHRSGWDMQVQVQQFQTIDDDLIEPYRMLPRVQLYRGFKNTPFHLDYQMLAQYTYFDAPSSGRLAAARAAESSEADQAELRVSGGRLYLEPALRFPLYWRAGHLIPTVKYRQLFYHIDDQDASLDDSPDLGSAVFSLDAGIAFERHGGLFGDDYVQTLEPRIYYLWSEFEEHPLARHADAPLGQGPQRLDFDTANLTFSFNQLFRDTRFSGYDRLADANQISLALTTRFLDQREGIERFSASIGQIRYFEDRDVFLEEAPDTGSKSQIAGEVSFRLAQHTRVTSSVLWDPGRGRFDETGINASWYDKGYLFNIGYSYRRQALPPPPGEIVNDNINQADVSGVVPLAKKWRAFARYQYDFTEDQSTEEMLGFEYRSCCWAFRFVYQEGLDRDGQRDEGIFFEFVFFGLGALGDSIDNLLGKSIRDYDRTRVNSDGF